MTHKKRRAYRSPQRKSQKKPKLLPWQGVVAAIIAGTASIVVALIATLSPSSTDSPSAQSAANLHSVGPSAETPEEDPELAITSYTENQLKPPPGREQYSFYGTIKGLPQEEIISSQIYVVASSPGNDSWLVSPPAKISDKGTWAIKSWIIVNPPADARWNAVITNEFTGIREAQPLPKKLYEEYQNELYGGPTPIENEEEHDLEENGPSAATVQLASKPFRISRRKNN